MNMNGKVAIVTGGTSGIGLATVKKLAAAGAFVYACAIDECGCKFTESNIKYLYLDVTDAVISANGGLRL